MTYHINTEGKISICRAKVRKCPYGNDRHSERIEDLYAIVAEENVTVRFEDSFEKSLKAGTRIDISIFDKIINRLPYSPVESIVDGYALALKYKDTNTPPAEIRQGRKHVIETAAAYYIASGSAQPLKDLPQSMNYEALTIARESGQREGFISSIFSNRKVSPELWSKVQKLGPTAKKVLKWEQDHQYTPSTDEINKRYKRDLTEKFNYYSNALNLSKLLSRPSIKNPAELERIVNNIPNLSDEELYSLYDDLNLPAKEVDKMAEKVDNFEYKEIPELSSDSNEILKKWFDNQKNKLNHFQLRNSANVLISMSIAKELMSREGVFVGDFNQNTLE